MPRNYVDNAYNRSVGRVGQPVGSHVISRSSGGGGGGGSLSSGISAGGGRISGAGSSTYSGVSGSTKTYVDNAYNRREGRVGLPVGTCVISKSSSGSPRGQVGSASLTGSTKTYVDNEYNRREGRVGLPVGTCVISKSSSGSPRGQVGSASLTGNTKTYVDNEYNRREGRVGLPVGTCVITKSSSGSPRGQVGSASLTGSTRTYVDNEYNRREGRVGLPVGSCVISKKSTGSSSSTIVGSGSGSGLKGDVGVYTDNPLNRRLGRVGKPRGTCVYSRKDGTTSSRTYADNKMNRKLGRVGEPLGSRPVSGKSSTTKEIKKWIDNHTIDKVGAPLPHDITMYPKPVQEDYGVYPEPYHVTPVLEDYDVYPEPYDVAPVPKDYGVSEYSDEIDESGMCHINRKLEELRWRDESKRSEQPQSSKKIIEDYRGRKIDFDEIKLGKKIGQGGFGDVFFASWRSTVVAVKKLRVQRVSKRRLQDFTQEVLDNCKLNNENIVTFIGACVVTPNLALVMEYMQMSLFDALHIEEGVDFTEQDQISIMCQTVNGLQYLHDTKKMAHCDMKSQNVLLNYEPDETLQAKLTDFGLSMVKSDAETSLSARPEDLVRNVGTPRYSAPEVLRGEYLSAEAMMMSDVYSLGLIFFEVIYEEEPFYNMTYAQLQKQVGDAGKTPKLSTDFDVDEKIKLAMTKCWLFDPSKRPAIKELAETLKNTTSLY